jgi:ABC-type multidrug transport system permease subunit
MMFPIVKNQLQVLLRSRAALAVMILAPLLLLFIGGIVFDTTSVYRVKVGVWSESPTALSESLIGALESTQFNVKEYPSEDACSQSVKRGDEHACLAFLGSFASGASNTVRFYVDPSRATLVSSILDAVEKKINARSTDVSAELAQSLVSALQSIRNTVSERKETMVALTTQVNTASQNAATLSASVGAPNTTLDLQSAGLTNASASASLLEFASLELANQTLELIADVQAAIADADAVLNATNLTNSSKQSIRSGLLNASSAADDVVGAVNDSSALIVSANVTGAMSVLETRLAETKLNIDKVSAFQSSLSIAGLQKGFNDIEAALNSITVTDAAAISSPIKTQIVPVTREDTYVNYAFPFLMVIVLLFSGLLVAPIVVLTERHSQAAFRTFLSPVKERVFAQATFVSCFIVLSAQAVLMLLVAGFFFNFWAGLPVLIVTLAVLSALFILMGIIIGSIVQKELTAVLTSVVVGLVLLFLSDFIVPLDALPRWLSVLASLTPVGCVGFAENVLEISGLVILGGVLAFFALQAFEHGRQWSLQVILSRVLKKK